MPNELDDDELNVDGDCSLREAVQATNTNAAVDACIAGDLGVQDTINLGGNVFDLDLVGAENDNLTGDLDVEAGTGGLRLLGTPAATIDADVAVTQDRVLHAESGPVQIQGVTISDGDTTTAGTPGGGIFTQTNATLTLTDSVVTANDAGGAGGGIQINGGGGATITGTDIVANTAAAGGGGGIGHSALAPLSISESRLIINSVNGTSPVISGGGISFTPGGAAPLTISNSSIDGNTATGTILVRGGGLSTDGGTAAQTITSTLISNNDAVASGVGATAGGGGLRIGAATPMTVTTSEISANTSTVSDPGASNVGGGVLNLGATTIRRSTISGNSLSGGTQGGGGIRDESSLTLVNDTIADNTATSGGGGGLDAAGTTTGIFNSTFSGNNAATGDGLQRLAGTLGLRGSIVDNAVAADACAGTITSNGFNVAVGTSCVDGTVAGDEENATPNLEVLGDWGGPEIGRTGVTQALETQPPDPLLNSTAIDHIPASPTNNCTDEGGVNPLTVDERGFARPQDGNADAAADCDAGAVEVYACAGQNATEVGTAAGDTLNGTPGAQVFHGAGGNDTINAGGGADLICGGDGNDTMDGGDTNASDTFRGGDAGEPTDTGPDDEVTYANAMYAAGVTVNLTSDTTTGTGNDTLGGVENVRGGAGGDGLIGDAENNELRGGGGDDFMAGGDGDDLFDGQTNDAGGDSVNYFQAPVTAMNPITASLQNGTATGQGTDTLMGLENLRGGNNNDNLTGDAGVNDVRGANGNDTITGLGSMDVLRGEDNDDSILARDGVQDDVDCGSGTVDFTELDQQGVDLFVNCEFFSFFVPPVVTPTPTPTTTPTVTTPADDPCPDLRKRLKKAKKKAKKTGKKKKVKKLQKKLRKNGC